MGFFLGLIRSRVFSSHFVLRGVKIRHELRPFLVSNFYLQKRDAKSGCRFGCFFSWVNPFPRVSQSFDFAGYQIRHEFCPFLVSNFCLPNELARLVVWHTVRASVRDKLFPTLLGAYSKNKKKAKPPCMKYTLGFAFLHFKAHQLLSKLGKVILRAEFNFARGFPLLLGVCLN